MTEFTALQKQIIHRTLKLIYHHRELAALCAKENLKVLQGFHETAANELQKGIELQQRKAS